MPTGDIFRPASLPPPGAEAFEPSAALAALDDIVDGRPVPGAGSAWDAAWIACLTNSPRWAETARREFLRITGGVGAGQS